jgi:molybdenum cofactor synthesis domain-containing protein
MLVFSILTVSDRSSSGIRPDLSGPALSQYITEHGYKILRKAIVPDELNIIHDMLLEWCDSGESDIILTTGGTGFAPRDVTPEATLSIIEKNAPGLTELMRLVSLKKTPHAALSRSVAGIRKQTLIINLPGSPKAAVENLGVVFPILAHAVELIKNDPSSEFHH